MPATEGSVSPKPINANAALLLLLAINLFNYIDRQVLAAVEPEIRKELLEGVADDQAKTRMGLLSTAFLVSYMLLAPVFGWLADRWSRWWLVGIGVILWSLASGASGVDWGIPLAGAYWVLLITRCFVGIGEGAYGPIAPAMIADLYPVTKRGQVMAWFYLAIPVGGALGYAFGEVMMKNFGWRSAFYAVVPPGVLLGILCYFMRDPPRGRAESSTPPKAGIDQYLTLLKIPSYILNTLGMTAMTFAIGGLAYWMPAYLEERKAPDLVLFRPAVDQNGAKQKQKVAEASQKIEGNQEKKELETQGGVVIGPRTIFGALTALAGLIATISGGILGDKLRGRFPGSYFLVSGIALMLGFPAVLGFLYTPFPQAWIFVFLAVFCLFFNTGPTNTILANVSPPAIRASAFALNILIIHALGDAISPPVIGFIADHSEGGSLKWGFIAVSAIMLAGGVFWLLGMKHLQRDTERAETQN